MRRIHQQKTMHRNFKTRPLFFSENLLPKAKNTVARHWARSSHPWNWHPKTFLRLQTAAKAFMLDEAHPERRDVVGHKKNSGGADLAKLNLWNCVDEFLSLHGHGEKFFAPAAGNDIPGAPQRSLFWPLDSQLIIKLMMPLMRKMVTNERQRIYAATTRKHGSTKGTSEEQSPVAVEQSIMTDEDAPATGYPEQDIPVQPLAPAHPDPTGPPLPDPTQPLSSASTQTQCDRQAAPAPRQSMVLYVNVVSHASGTPRRVIPRFQPIARGCPQPRRSTL